MRNRLLEIVAFLIDVIRDGQEHPLASEDISLTLHELGYTDLEISTAYNWFINRFNDRTEDYYADFPVHNSSLRVLTESERSQMDAEAANFLLKMAHTRVIDTEQLEQILDRLHIFSSDMINLDEIKMLVSSVMFKEFETVQDYPYIDITDEMPGIVH